MGATKFIADLTKINRMALVLEKVEPKEIRWAMARMLNDMAFTARPIGIKVINQHMTVRNQAYVNKTMRFGRTSGNLPVAAQSSWMGAIGIGDRTGWVEQQFDRKPAQKARHGLQSRGKNKKRRVLKSRYRRGKANHPRQFKGRTPIQREVGMLLQLRFWGDPTEQFIAEGNGLFKRGIYGFDKAMNPVWLSTIDTAPRTRSFKWLDRVRDRVIFSYPVMQRFNKEYVQQLKRRLR